jgi:hypothetical protein
VHGISTRKVDESVKALGMWGISKSLVSTSCVKSSMMRASEACRWKTPTPKSGSMLITARPVRTVGWPPQRWS